MLQAEIKAFQREKEAFSGPISALGSDEFALNVGGRKFDVLRNTLTSVEGSILAAKFSGRWEDSLERDAEGRIFIDAKPEYFAVLLDQLRSRMWGGTSTAVSMDLPSCATDFQGNARRFQSLLFAWSTTLG